ncbi:hypothetical protein ACLB2K_063584 [Fragaria x ananassa]
MVEGMSFNYYGVLVSVIELIYSKATLGRDDESGPSEPTTDQLNEPYQEESPHIVPDTKDIRVNNQHIPDIIDYIPVTSSELNSLQCDPNHDDDGFIDDEYIKDVEYSDQIEEHDDSDDSDYHEAAPLPEPTTSTSQRLPIPYHPELCHRQNPPPPPVRDSAIHSLGFKMVIFGKKKDRATKASALMDSI